MSRCPPLFPPSADIDLARTKTLRGACEFFFSTKQLLGPVFRERKVDEQIKAEFGR
jgi:hypothetical protein